MVLRHKTAGARRINEHGGVMQHKEFERFVRAMIANAVEMAILAEN